MSLSLKAELELWAAALKAYDEQDFAKALDLFFRIADSSKILTNMGLIYATIGEHETAVKHFVAATNLDPYLAIAHFQCGVSNFLLQRYNFALLNFEDAYLYLRGNEAINYDQLGLKFKLFSAEIVFNKALTQIKMGCMEQGMACMQEASMLKITREHGVIDEAVRNRGERYTVFSIPVGVLYRPSESKLKNSKTKDYLGKAKLVAASDFKDTFTEFTGVKKLQQASVNKTEDENSQDKPDVEPSTPPRIANTGVMDANPNMYMGTAGANMATINDTGAKVRRKVTRRPTTTRRVVVYDEDDGDDGFVTGEYEELEIANIRVKLHYRSDVRGMTISPTTSFEELVERVTTKFGTSSTGLGMRFTDEEGTKISLRDQSDFELAIETARENAKGRSGGKVELWCVDV